MICYFWLFPAFPTHLWWHTTERRKKGKLGTWGSVWKRTTDLDYTTSRRFFSCISNRCWLCAPQCTCQTDIHHYQPSSAANHLQNTKHTWLKQSHFKQIPATICFACMLKEKVKVAAQNKIYSPQVLFIIESNEDLVRVFSLKSKSSPCVLSLYLL